MKIGTVGRKISQEKVNVLHFQESFVCVLQELLIISLMR